MCVMHIFFCKESDFGVNNSQNILENATTAVDFSLSIVHNA